MLRNISVKGVTQMDLIFKKHSFVSKKDNKEKSGFNFYIKTESGLYIAIRPVFDDYQKLRAIARLED